MKKVYLLIVFCVGLQGWGASYYAPEKISSLDIGDITIVDSAVYEDVLIILGEYKIYTFDISDINNPQNLQEIDMPWHISELIQPGKLQVSFMKDHFVIYYLERIGTDESWLHKFFIFNCSHKKQIYFESEQNLDYINDNGVVFNYTSSSAAIGFHGKYFYSYFYSEATMEIMGFMVTDFSDVDNINKAFVCYKDAGDGRMFIVDDHLVYVSGEFKIYDISDPYSIEYISSWTHDSVPGYSYIHGSDMSVKNNVFYGWGETMSVSDNCLSIVDFTEPVTPVLIHGEVNDDFKMFPMDFIVNENLFVGKQGGSDYGIFTIDSAENQMISAGQITGTTIFHENNGYLFAYENNSLCIYTIIDHTDDNQYLITDIEFTPVNRDDFSTKVTVLCEAQIRDTAGFEVMFYHWDFDGDGVVDEVTSEHFVQHEFAFAGTYPVTLMLESSDGIFSLSYTENLNVMEDPSPTVPEDFRGFFSGDSDITLYWNASTDNNGVKYYAIYRGEDNSLVGTTNNTSYTVNGVSHTEMYRFKLKAFDYFGNVSAFSSEAVVIPEDYDSEPPSVPQMFVGAGIYRTLDIHLSWEPSTDNVGVSFYAIYNSEDNSLVATTPYTSYVLRDLDYDVTYRYKIKAFDYADNRSGFSRELQVRTWHSDYEDPTVPGNLTAVGSSSTDILLRWDPSTDNHGVRFYAVYEILESGNDYPVYELLGTSYTNEFTVIGLEENTTYTFGVKAFDFSGRKSGLSNTVSCQTLKPDTQSPTAPSNLTGTVYSGVQVKLTWESSTDDQGVRFYAIYKGASNTLVGTTWLTEYLVEGLAPDTEYTFKVKAFDYNDNRSGFSNEISVTTDDIDPSPAPEGFVFIRSGLFEMGSDSDAYTDNPVHEVNINQFYLAKYEVTIEQFVEFLNSVQNVESHWYFNFDPYSGMSVDYAHIIEENNTYFVEDGYEQYPMGYVSWFGAKAYCDWLTETQPGTFYLPSETEWEYACRAVSYTEYFWGNSWDDDYGWCSESYDDFDPHPVGQKNLNNWGLYDMSGNVREWCSDWYFTNAYNNSGGYEDNPSGNPVYAVSNFSRVCRGGGQDDRMECKSAHRAWRNPVDYTMRDTGFRVARTVSSE